MLANRKIVIIGTGHVGSHCAYALAIQGICDEIVLVDKDRTKAKSHSMDIADSVSFFNSSVIVIIIPFISILFKLLTMSLTHSTEPSNTSSRVCPGSLGTPALITTISASLQSL